MVITRALNEPTTPEILRDDAPLVSVPSPGTKGGGTGFPGLIT